MRPSRLLRSATFRLALLYLGLFSVSVLLLFGFIYWATVGYQARQLEAAIDADVEQLRASYREQGRAGLRDALDNRLAHVDDPRSLILFADAAHRPLAGNLGQWPEDIEAGAGWSSFEVEPTTGDDDRDAFGRVLQLSGGEWLLVGRDVSAFDRQRELIAEALLWGLGATVLLGLIGGVAISLGTLRKIERISRTSQAVMAGDLTQRIPLSGHGDDIDQLAANLNAMLDQIQALLESLRQVSNDVAHDLRTPLTRLRGQLEELHELQSIEAQRAGVERAIAEADALLATFNALLRIAQVEAGGLREGFAPVDLAAVVGDVAELYEPLAADENLTLAVRLGENITVPGDRDLLFQALANLLDNAIKYTPAGGAIELSLTADAAGAQLTVADTGPGIPAPERDRVLRRFYRLERHRSQAGNGLGLSLVAAVAKRHGGRLILSDNHPGLRVTLTVPSRNDRVTVYPLFI